MIIDTIDNFDKYLSLNPLFPKVLEFLKHHNLNELSEGTHEIDGKRLFVNVITTTGRRKEDAVLETHVEMVDIQIPLNAQETYGYIAAERLPDVEFNKDADLALYPEVQPADYVSCHPDQFVIFFPQDGHAPMISEEKSLHKVIFKVKA